VHNADAGLHASTFLRAGLRDGDVLQRMSAQGLTANALSECYAGARRRHGLLLGFGGSSERRIESATRTLGEVLNTMSS
jgi:GntR family transcriptional regulator/MocR family aminotransferase